VARPGRFERPTNDGDSEPFTPELSVYEPRTITFFSHLTFPLFTRNAKENRFPDIFQFFRRLLTK